MLHVCPRDGCNRVFTRKANLDGHLNAHDGLQPYQCSYCTTRFTRRNEQRAHEREQHNRGSARQEFPCHVCGTSFPRKSTLDRHLGASSVLRRCPKKAALFMQTPQLTGFAMAPWSMSLDVRVLQPALLAMQDSPTYDDEEHQTAPVVQHANPSLMYAGTYPADGVLTKYRASTESFYDWTVVGFKVAVSSLNELHALIPILGPHCSENLLMTTIATTYDCIIHRTVLVFTKAPLQLTTPLIFALSLLDLVRDNEKGESMLNYIIDDIDDKTVRRRSLAQHRLDEVCFTELGDASGPLLHDSAWCLSLDPLPTNSDDTLDIDRLVTTRFVVVGCYLMFSAYMASLFSFWSREATIKGLDHQAAIAGLLHRKLDPLVRELYALVLSFATHNGDVDDTVTLDVYIEQTSL